MKKITLIALIGFLVAGVEVNAQTTYQNLSREKIVNTEQLPIRDVRKTAVWFNMGWNGLTGFGANLSLTPLNIPSGSTNRIITTSPGLVWLR